MQKFAPIAVLPTLFTLGNLVCGFFSIVVASRVERPLTDPHPAESRAGRRATRFDSNDPTHNIMLSGWLIFLAHDFRRARWPRGAAGAHVERFRRRAGQPLRRGDVRRCAGLSAGENVSLS